MKIGFDNDEYLKIQSEHIKERIARFGDNYIWNSAANFSTTIMPAAFSPASNLTVNSECSCN